MGNAVKSKKKQSLKKTKTLPGEERELQLTVESFQFQESRKAEFLHERLFLL